MSHERSGYIRPFVYTVGKDDGVNVTIEITEEDYLADLAAGYRGRDNQTGTLRV